MSQRTRWTEAELKSAIARNPGLLKEGYVTWTKLPLSDDEKPVQGNSVRKPARLHSQRVPNKTETEFGRILRSRFPSANLRYEAIRLAFGEGQHYVGDWVVTEGTNSILIVEVKGPHKRNIDVARYKSCKAEWKHVFRFEFWQKCQGDWVQLD